MAKIAKNRYVWADEVDEEHEYEMGRYLSANKKMISFWIHVIDGAFSEIEDKTSGSDDGSKPSSVLTGGNMPTVTLTHIHEHVAPSVYTWLGGVREGYRIIFDMMPFDVRSIVSDYFAHRNANDVARAHVLIGKGYPSF